MLDFLRTALEAPEGRILMIIGLVLVVAGLWGSLPGDVKLNPRVRLVSSIAGLFAVALGMSMHEPATVATSPVQHEPSIADGPNPALIAGNPPPQAAPEPAPQSPAQPASSPGSSTLPKPDATRAAVDAEVQMLSFGATMAMVGYNYRDAFDKYTRIIELLPDAAWAYAGRGQARGELGDRAGALQDLAYARHLYVQAGDEAQVRTTVQMMYVYQNP